MSNGLFESLLGPAWSGLPASVRALHDGRARLSADGLVEVGGAKHAIARGLRWLLRLPAPASCGPLRVVIETDRDGELWTRYFADARMSSRLSRDRRDASLLSEQLGPVRLRFALVGTSRQIDWHLRDANVLGLPLPQRWLDRVHSSSGIDATGRYHFVVDARLPLVGHLVAYRGWLEISTDDVRTDDIGTDDIGTNDIRTAEVSADEQT